MQYLSRVPVRPVDAISARCRESLERKPKRATELFRAVTREIKRKAPTHSQECRGCFCVFGAPYGRRKTHEQPHQNRTKNTPVLSISHGAEGWRAVVRCRGCLNAYIASSSAPSIPRKSPSRAGFPPSAGMASQKRDKTATKVRQKTRLCGCLGGTKPGQK